MRVNRIFGITSLIFAACAGNPPAVAPPPAAPSDLDRAAATITPQDMFDRIAYLASDELAGRNTPSAGLELAASYISEQFRSFGLRPAGDSGTYIQRWTYRQTTFDPLRTSLRVNVVDTTFTPRLGDDFFVLPAGADSTSGALYWTGPVPQGQPLGPEAAGKFATILLPGKSPDSAWNAGIVRTLTSALPARVAGIFIILDAEFDDGLISQIAMQIGSQQAPIYLIGMRYATARTLIARAGYDLDALRDGQAAIALPNTMATIAIARTASESRPPNVVGMLIGSDPMMRDQFIVFSAHMDHVGTGRADASGDSIFNGADDDASGTATMIEVAEAFAALPNRTARSLLFLAVSGEEKGLLGSAHFVENPPVPREKIVANINLDMVGRNAPDTVVAIGQDYSSLGPLAQQVGAAHPELGLVVAPDLWPEERLFFRSDHFNFAKSGVPALFFTTGLHPQYHRQSDEVELIDRDKIARVGRLVFYFAHQIAVRSEAPAWTERGRAEVGGMIGR